MSWKYRLGQRVEVKHKGEWLPGVVEAHRNGDADRWDRGFYHIRLSSTRHGDGYTMNWIAATARDIREPKEGKG